MNDIQKEIKKTVDMVKSEFIDSTYEFESEVVNPIRDEIVGMKTDLAKLGWNVLFPLIPLIGLVLLILHALL